jgi:Ca2+-binding RTX toxin-like protein
LGGHDEVDGGEGYDQLRIAYTSTRLGFIYPWPHIVWDGTQFSGKVNSSNFDASATFKNIESLDITLSDNTQRVSFAATALPGNSSAVINAGGGRDVLVLSLGIPDTFFDASSQAGIVTNLPWKFVGFEQFEIFLGGGSNVVTTSGSSDFIKAGLGRNIINAGGRSDQIVSQGGVDTIDGGEGSDFWSLALSDTNINWSFRYDGSTQTGSLSNGSSAKSIESVVGDFGSGNDQLTLARGAGSFRLGAGSDYVSLSQSSYVSVDGGVGIDTLILDQRGSQDGGYSYLEYDPAAGYSGSAVGSSFTGFENITLYFDDFGNSLQVQAEGLKEGAKVRVVAGAGHDYLSLDFEKFSAVRVSVGSDNVLRYGSGVFIGFDKFEIQGGEGDDVITGSRTLANKLFGGAGNDFLIGGSGVDYFSGGDGDDKIYGRGGADEIYGGDGNDTFVLGLNSSASRINEYPDGGYDTVHTLDHHFLNDYVERLIFQGADDLAGGGNWQNNVIVGNSGNNLLYGGDGNDTLSGRAGMDQIYGDDGDDVINGGDGDDFLWGGAGIDRLIGGAGSDQFGFVAMDVPTGRDIIPDFQAGEDMIALDKAAFGGTPGSLPQPLDPSAFIVGTKALTAEQRIIYDEKRGNLFFDSDGSGPEAAVHLATLTTKPVLTAESFIVL